MRYPPQITDISELVWIMCALLRGHVIHTSIYYIATKIKYTPDSSHCEEKLSRTWKKYENIQIKKNIILTDK